MTNRQGGRARAALVCLLLLVLFTLLSAQRIDLISAAADLGRHLKNGELLLSRDTPAGTADRLLHTNFYSYAEWDAPFVNSHWLSGVVFYLVWRCIGFAGLSLFYIALGALTAALFFRIAVRAAGLLPAATLAVVLISLIMPRTGVRPEIFTWLFTGIFFSLLWSAVEHPPPGTALLALPILEVLWMNLHIGFPLGVLLVVVFFLADLFQRRTVARIWMAIVPLTAAATFVNPSGWAGALYPILIAPVYPYKIVENNSILRLEEIHFGGETHFIEIALVILIASFGFVISRKAAYSRPLLALGAIAAAGTWMIYRNYPMLGFMTLAIVPVNLAALGWHEWYPRNRRLAIGICGVLIVAFGAAQVSRLWDRRASIGLGLEPRVSDAAEFFNANNMSGPIFNNFNIGGYLIYYLYPRERPFFDSRPEAYTAQFIQDCYIRPQIDERNWARLMSIYQFNAIFASRIVNPEEDRFLLRRLADPEWAPVFFDPKAMILLRQTDQNRALIQSLEIPRDRVIRRNPERQ